MWRTVVGVVSDVRYRGLQEVQLDVYDAALQTGRPADNIVVRTSVDPIGMASAVRSIARELDPAAIVDNVTTLDAVVTRAEAPWRLTMWLFVLFAGLAFALSALGCSRSWRSTSHSGSASSRFVRPSAPRARSSCVASSCGPVGGWQREPP